MAQSLTNRNRVLEKYLQVVREDGLNTNKNVNIGINGATPNLWVAGNVTVGGTISSTAGSGATTITASSADALAVGSNGITNPALQVDTSGGLTDATGLYVNANTAGSGLGLAAISSGTNENLTIDAKGSGTVTINGTATGIVVLPAGTTIGGSVPLTSTITSSSANALAVGQNGTTNPAFNVDASTATSATGVTVKSAAAGGSAAISTTSSGTNEGLVISSKGTGNINLNTGGGNIQIIGTSASLNAAGSVTAGSATAITAGGSLIGIKVSSTAAFGVFVGSGAPTISAAQGSLYLRSDGSTTTNRAYINNSSGSGTTWTALTTAA